MQPVGWPVRLRAAHIAKTRGKPIDEGLDGEDHLKIVLAAIR
jgi:hypothetical protein